MRLWKGRLSMPRYKIKVVEKFYNVAEFED